MKGRTSVVIAHRLSTILAADQILVLDHGRLVEQGSHEVLLSQGGLYRELFQTQFRAVTVPPPASEASVGGSGHFSPRRTE
jgi:ABC-type multidrug transport system fused ATPase/permease subunit